MSPRPDLTFALPTQYLFHLALGLPTLCASKALGKSHPGVFKPLNTANRDTSKPQPAYSATHPRCLQEQTWLWHRPSRCLQTPWHFSAHSDSRMDPQAPLTKARGEEELPDTVPH